MKETANNDAIVEQGVASEKPVKIDAKDELTYYKKLKTKYKGYLVEGLDEMEMQRIANHIIDLYDAADKKHQELCDRIDEYDSIWRMERKQIVGDDGDMPNYRTPMSTVAHETIHANTMNVFFSPKDPMRVIPTEPNDVPKVNKLTTFGNWSMNNEMELQEAVDRLFHSSEKVGECPYIVHWVKEWGIEIVRKVKYDPANPQEPLYDPDTGEVEYEETEEPKLLYNGPKLEVLSRKDYLEVGGEVAMGELPEGQIQITRYGYDDIWKDELKGRMYEGCTDLIKSWGSNEQALHPKKDYQGEEESLGKYEREVLRYYGKLRVNVIKEDDKRQGIGGVSFEELEDEFIAEVHKQSKTLLSLRKNKFPLKMRPIDVDYFIPDDDGRRHGIGIYEFMQYVQKAYDTLFNQYIFAVTQANNPFGFFTPTGNIKDEPYKIRHGYMYPTADANSVNIIKLPQPDQSMQIALQLLSQWAQLLFGISDYAAGVESKIDPGAPARKAQMIVEQGNVRLNLLIKRRARTLRNIFKRWYLLYRDNMPPNKFMRIVGDDENNPWKFESIKMEDFQLKSLPDFELTGNILSSNKQLQANMAIATYQLLVGNPFFNPQTQKGLQSLHSLTKWLIDKLDDTGLQRFMPQMPGEDIMTPEEENAKFLQGDTGTPVEGEDHLDHIRKHVVFLNDPLVPEQIKPAVAKHIALTVEMYRQEMTQQAVMQQAQQFMPAPTPQMGAGMQGQQPGQPQIGGPNAISGGVGTPNGSGPVGVLPERQGSMGGIQGPAVNLQR